MAGYNVTVVHENRYKIVNSASVPSEGTIKDNIFVRDDGKKAEIIGVLKEGFKRQFFRDDKGNDYAYKEGTSVILYCRYLMLSSRELPIILMSGTI